MNCGESNISWAVNEIIGKKDAVNVPFPSPMNTYVLAELASATVPYPDDLVQLPNEYPVLGDADIFTVAPCAPDPPPDTVPCDVFALWTVMVYAVEVVPETVTM